MRRAMSYFQRLIKRIPFEGEWCSSRGTRYISSLNREGRACQSLQADERSPNKSWQHIHRQSRLNCCINPEARVPTQQFNKRRCVPPHPSGKETDLTARGACQCQAREAVSVMGQCVNCFQCQGVYLLAFFRHCQGKKDLIWSERWSLQRALVRTLPTVEVVAFVTKCDYTLDTCTCQVNDKWQLERGVCMTTIYFFICLQLLGNINKRLQCTRSNWIP